MTRRAFIVAPEDRAGALDIVGERKLASGEATGGYEIFLQRRMFTDVVREVAPANPDLGRLAEMGGRHGFKLGA